MIGLILGIILCAVFGFFAIGAIVVNHEEHEKKEIEEKK